MVEALGDHDGDDIGSVNARRHEVLVFWDQVKMLGVSMRAKLGPVYSQVQIRSTILCLRPTGKGRVRTAIAETVQLSFSPWDNCP